jgi:hypothetical protein
MGEIQNARRKDEGTTFTLRVKEQAQEHSKVEKQWRYSISLFQTIPNWKHLRQILTHPDSAVRFSHTHFY